MSRQSSAPRWLPWLASRLLPSRDRDAIVADLDEDYARRARRGGRAAFWYLAQVIHLSMSRSHAFPEPVPMTSKTAAFSIASVLQDVRYGLRTLRRNPLFTFVAVASLALGIGLNSTIFAVVDRLLFRPLPVESPETLAAVFTSDESGEPFATTSYPDLVDIRATNSVFTDVIGHTMMFAAVNVAGQNRLAFGEVVTANYFTALGIRPVVGRGFLPDEEQGQGAHPVALISHNLWQRGFGGGAEVLGRTLTIKTRPYTIVGVVPADFTGMMPGVASEIWIPVSMVEDVEPAGMNDVVPSATGSTRLEMRGTRWLFVKGRLREDATVAAAEGNVNAIMARLAAEYPISNKARSARVVPATSVRFHPLVDNALRPAGVVLMAAVGLVLLVACANLASMLLARGASRTRELALRSALGGDRRRLIRQLLVESLVLASLGGAAGLVLAWWATGALGSAKLPIDLPLSFTLSLDGRAIAFTMLITLATGLLFGLLPAVRASRPDLVPALKDDASLASRGRRFGARHALVSLQVAVSVILLVGGLLMTRSLVAAHATSTGFQTRGLVVATISLDLLGYEEGRSRQFFDRAHDTIQRLPGARAVAVTERVPFSPNVQTTQIVVDGRPDVTPGASVDVTRVSEEYFDTMGVRVTEGRAFDTRDTADTPRVAIVSEAFAARFFPGERAVGRRLRLRDQSGPTIDIVGVSADYSVRTVGEAPRPVLHLARRQRFSSSGSFIVRTDGDADLVRNGIERELRALEPNLVFLELTPLERMIATSLLPVSLGSALIAGLAGLAMLLAGLGLYGVIAFSVARRTREIGIRMALGATRAGVIRRVLAEGLLMVAVGGAVGLGAAAVGAQALSAVLHGVTPYDPLSYLAALAFVIAGAVISSLIPARRAASINPIAALRSL